MALAITEENFEKEVLQSAKPVLLDFWADWCPPCKMIAPIIDKLAEEYKDKITIAKVDVDSAGALAEKYGITSIPTLVLINKKEVVSKHVGAQQESGIIKIFQDYL